MKKIIKIVILLIALISLNILTAKVYGASSYVTVSKSSVNVGDTFTVKVAGNAASWNVKLNYSGPVKLVSGSTAEANATNSGKNEDTTFITATFKSTGEGTATFSASGQLVNSDYSSSSATGSKTVSITVPEPEVKDPVVNDKPAEKPTNTTKPTPVTKPVEIPKSSDNTLSELTIKEGAISPTFEKDVREYTLTIPYETTEVNVTAKPSDSKATVEIEGNKDLKEGENTVTIKVTAEDGTTTNYIVKVTRKRVPIALKSLVIKYKNQEGQIIESPLNPAFNFDTLEYTLQDLEHWVEKLSVEAIANIEGAIIDIQGADTLQTGENTITITLKITEEASQVKEGEEPKEETITYTIKVNKTEEPTLMAKISDWFKGIMGTVGTWFNNNKPEIILGALALCIVALIGLSIYIVVDYNKYKDVIAKVKKTTEINASSSIAEEIKHSVSVNEEIEDNNDKDDKPKHGKHF